MLPFWSHAHWQLVCTSGTQGEGSRILLELPLWLVMYGSRTRSPVSIKSPSKAPSGSTQASYSFSASLSPSSKSWAAFSGGPISTYPLPICSGVAVLKVVLPPRARAEAYQKSGIESLFCLVRELEIPPNVRQSSPSLP